MAPTEESRTTSSTRPLMYVLLFLISVAIAGASALILETPQQVVISVITFVIAIVLWKFKHSETIRRWLMAITILSAVRYIVWRVSFTLNMPDWITGTFSILLFGAELYTVYTLIGFYFQTFSLDRSAENIQPDPNFRPSVDVFIPTYNEDTDILRRTAVGALAMEYPNKKVYILDDGKRESMRDLAEELGCGYIVREKNNHAKAGNINNALKVTDGDLILILDADHVPVVTLLDKLTPFFKDEKVSLVQSPHRFMNPGPVERNVYLAGKVPFEQELFMQIVQVGNDHWNAAFFCGSAAVLRRSVLEQIGGIAIETVTEDCHTSIRMHALGYKSKYFPTPLIIGLSPESLAGFVIQHGRWARGATQMMRIELPLFRKGLSPAQRFCYFNGMLHFLFGIPRLIFYCAPVWFLLFNIYPVKTNLFCYMVMGLSYIACSFLTNNCFYKNFRHSFWSDIYEAVLAPVYAVVTTAALFDPKAGKFNVTPKGTNTDGVYFDRSIAMPNIVIFCILTVTFFVGVWRSFCDPGMRDAIMVNLFWTTYNMFIVGIAILCAVEQTFTRRAHRVRRKLDAVFTDKSGRRHDGSTVLTTEFGSLVRVTESSFAKGDIIKGRIAGTVHNRNITCEVTAEVRYVETSGGAFLLGLQYRDQTPDQLRDLILLSYCEPSMWEHLREPEDQLGGAAWDVISTPSRVLKGTRLLLKATPMLPQPATEAQATALPSEPGATG